MCNSIVQSRPILIIISQQCAYLELVDVNLSEETGIGASDKIADRSFVACLSFSLCTRGATGATTTMEPCMRQ